MKQKMEPFPLHQAVFNGDLESVVELLQSPDGSKLVNEKDTFGNTPLHLAVMLGRKDCVKILLGNQADATVKNGSGWTPLAEAVSYGNRQTIKRVYRSLKQQHLAAADLHRPKLITKLAELRDFQLEVKWEFHTWVPLLSRLLPSDVCRIYKKGSNIRMNSTLVEFNEMKWQRGDISFLFSEKIAGAKSLVVLDNEKKVYQSLRQDDSDQEIDEEIDYLMSSDIVAAQMSTKTISFSKVQTGWFFKQDKLETLGPYSCQVYLVNGMTLVSRKRREHLSEDDLRKNKALTEALTKGDPAAEQEIIDIRSKPDKHRESLPHPPPCNATWDDYISSDSSRPVVCGRKMIVKEERKSVKAMLWMNEDFPLSVELLLSILEVIAPSKHFKKLREFITIQLPTGFPVKIELPVLPTIVARISFEAFSFTQEMPDSLFEIPSDYKEDPYHFSDL